jgi:repressor of nif and glnA expression
MTVRKAKLGKKIDMDILRVLHHQERPISTRDIAMKIGRAWHSVQGHCLRLQIKGKIVGYRISNLNVWELKR